MAAREVVVGEKIIPFFTTKATKFKVSKPSLEVALNAVETFYGRP